LMNNLHKVTQIDLKNSNKICVIFCCSSTGGFA
jgi:hypothetical protein